jgi:hypothetical protein
VCAVLSDKVTNKGVGAGEVISANDEVIGEQLSAFSFQAEGGGLCVFARQWRAVFEFLGMLSARRARELSAISFQLSAIGYQL